MTDPTYTIDDYVQRSFDDRPRLLSGAPSGERYLWLERAGDGWAIMDEGGVNSPVDGAEDADALVRAWARDVGGDWDASFAARLYAGAEVGQCTGCEAWLIMPEDDRDPARHAPDCEALDA